ncbi:Protein kinase superfamily protein [Euphorbia peplus]|nr:Protein kinase superfamily protein [Euphorbia peplus]
MGVCLSSTIKSLSGVKLKMKKIKEDPEKETETETEEEGMILESPNLRRFNFRELKAVTRNFCRHNVLGEGGFGVVFKGCIEELEDEHQLQHSPTVSSSPPETITLDVAVKMLGQNSSQGQQEWLVEIKYLGQLYHPNLVELIGYCSEDEKRLLVYEFMPNGSLDNALYSRRSKFEPLSWNLRLKIAIGAAKGLAFLHDKARVIYRDLKASNILLDQNYNAKLSDFGFAKDGPAEYQSHITSRTLGSYGYSAPEYTNHGRLSTKVDVYSYGVVLLEIVSGRAAIDRNKPPNEMILVEWAKLHLRRKRKAFLILDGRIEGKNALRGALNVAELALQCLSPDPRLRPTMNQVVKTLELLV